MPIYEYVCEECKTRFERIVSAGNGKTECPKCGSHRSTIQFFPSPRTPATVPPRALLRRKPQRVPAAAPRIPAVAINTICFSEKEPPSAQYRSAESAASPCLLLEECFRNLLRNPAKSAERT